MRLSSNRPLPRGLRVRVCLNNKVLDTFDELPAAFKVDLYAINRPKHALWIGLLDPTDRVLGRMERILPGRYDPTA